MNQIYTTDVLVVGGGTGGTVAAIQAARKGVKTILVSEFAWLGGMLTSAGVSAPDGNE
ncbi:MAG: FAD-dependent oxidoreductase, partial [Dolichospermum sp.]